jgi:phage gpG-like protein
VSVESDLREMADEMRRMAKEAPKAVSKAVGESSLRLVLQGFDQAKSPKGTPWAPLKEGTGKPLEGTGKLRGGIRLRPVRDGFVLTSDSPHGIYHQEGTERMPARPFLPDSDLHPTLERKLSDAADKALDKVSK